MLGRETRFLRGHLAHIFLCNLLFCILLLPESSEFVSIWCRCEVSERCGRFVWVTQAVEKRVKLPITCTDLVRWRRVTPIGLFEYWAVVDWSRAAIKGLDVAILSDRLEVDLYGCVVGMNAVCGMHVVTPRVAQGGYTAQ